MSCAILISISLGMEGGMPQNGMGNQAAMNNMGAGMGMQNGNVPFGMPANASKALTLSSGIISILLYLSFY